MWTILGKRPFFLADMAGFGKYRMGGFDRLGSKGLTKYCEIIILDLRLIKKNRTSNFIDKGMKY